MKSLLYPFVFRPIFKERVWGGRELERLFNKKLPPATPIGESWEISDRPGDESVVANGSFAGKTLRWLMQNYSPEILGRARPAAENRFPILCKILDARDKLSLQVHPPAAKAAELNGEPKTEMWFIADARPQAELFVGLKRGVTRSEFEEKTTSGAVAECFHRAPVHAGDAMFLPSGRVHAIGAGLVIFEIQQNSDTTYRVFDWNRVGLDGKPRELHVAQSLASIDFNDFEPTLVSSKFTSSDTARSRSIVRDSLFNVDNVEMTTGGRTILAENKLQILCVVRGRVEVQNEGTAVTLDAGQFCLIPAELEKTEVTAKSDTSLLRVEAGN
jgi:mannose-6-phosphate isomerase